MMRDRRESVQSKISGLLSTATRSNVLPNLEYAENTVVVPPDGGWGWVIVAMAFICYFLIDGVMYTFGLFLDEISDCFNVHPTQVALATSLMSGFYFVVGPLTCAVTNRYGFRIVGVLGGLIASAAFLLSTLFLNLNAFLILMGVFCGIGFNMIYIPCLLIVGFYFEKWRALATAISLCGSSLGVIAFPPMVTTLMKGLDWTWKFRILSGLTLLTSLCAFTFRPIRPVVVTDDSRRYTQATLDAGAEESVYSLNIEKDKQPGTKSMFKTYHNIMFPTASEYRDITSVYTIPRRMTTTSEQSIGKSTFIYKTDNQSSSLSTVYELEKNDEKEKRSCKNCCQKIFCCCKPSRAGSVNRPLYRDDIFYAGSLNFLPEYSRGAVVSGSSDRKSTMSYHLSVTRVATQRDIEQTGQCILCPEAIVRTIATMLHFKLFKSPTFVFLMISGFFSMAGMYCPFIFLVQRANDMQIDAKWSQLLLTFIGIANTLGRIMCGVISWFPKIDLLAINYISLIIAGASIIISNYVRNLAGQITFAVVFGFNIASLTVLRSIVVVDLLGLENLTNAFGLTSMFFGLGSFIGVPVAGVLKKYTGRYDESFIFAGCSMILSGLFFIPLRRLSDWETNKKKNSIF